VVEFMDQILGPEDADIADILRKRLEAEGTSLLTSTQAVKAATRGAEILLTVASAGDKGETRVLEADALLCATGRRPNVAELGLEVAGVEFTARGIPTNTRMQTTMRHIYACGDVNGQLPFTHVAGYEAGVALTNIVLHLPRRADYTKVGWCTYSDPEVASIGLNEKRAKAANIEYRVMEEYFRENDRALAEGESEGKIKLLISPRGKPLGCQIIGAHAGELIHEWAVAIGAGVKLSTMASSIHIYPTLSEISQRAAGRYFTEKLFSQRTRNILHLLFHLKGRACTPLTNLPQ
jgi:pyruvate/2-oxoglutarate dehydrogenase complex dihydrolipoamide dehydrogenase (E3) component